MSAAKRSIRSTLLLAAPLVAVLLLQIPCIAHAQSERLAASSSDSEGKDEGAAGDPRLAALHGVIEKAFVRGDAKLLRPAMSRRVKTYVASSALGASDGYYGADQTLLLFRAHPDLEGHFSVRFRLHNDSRWNPPAISMRSFEPLGGAK